MAAGGRIKGITIEIDGETKGLQKALSSITKESMSVTKELKDVERLLKLNPGNTELVAQKQKLLSKQIEVTSEKLKGLRDAQDQVQAQFEKGEIGEEQYRGFMREIEATEGALKGYKGQLENVETSQDRLGENTKRLGTLFEATGTSVDDFRDILGSRLTDAIKNGTASADDMEVALNKIGRASLGNDADIGQLKKTLDSIDDGNSVENVRMEIEKMGDSSLEATEKVGKLTEIAGSQMMMDVADKAAAASDKIIEIGQAGIEAAAEMRASEAAFEQVFGEIESQAQKTAESLGDELGMVPNRIKPGLAQTTSMFKGLGYDTEEALGMAERAVRSSADAAAFWDKSYEDASGSLSSFLKGNYEAGESVGIFANDSQMAAFAIANDLIPATEGAKEATEKQMIAVEKAQAAYTKAANKYGTGSLEARDKMLKLKEAQEDIANATGEQAGKWKDLDEATKQAVRLEYIENMQKMSEQTGQAAREMDGYENVMGNITSVTDEFMAAIGDEALSMFIEIAMSLIPVLQQVIEWIKNLSPAVKQFITIFTAAIAIVGAILPIIAALGAAAAVAGVSIGTLITTTILPMIGIIAAIAAGVTALILVIQNWGTISEWITTIFDAMGIDIQAVWDSIYTTISAVVQSVVDFIMNIWGILVDWWNENNGLILQTARTIWNAISAVITAVMNVLAPYLTMIWNNIKATIQAVWAAIQVIVTTAINVVLGIIKAVMQIINGDWKGAWETIKSVLSSVWSAIQDIVDTGVNFVNNIVTNTFNGLIGIVEGIWETIRNTISSAIEGARSAVATGIEAIKGLFNFQFKWPHIPLPHFSISGSANPLDWIKNGPPKLGVEWFAKGGILTKPTVFGQNGNNLMVGGEAGKEAVAPISTLMDYVRQAVAEANDNEGLIAAILALASREITLNIDGRAFAYATQEPVAMAQEEYKNKQGIKGGFRSVRR